ncbi:MAG: S9 family peptidase [Cytophagales bacterium]|nr:MAG: S9 family peptidase [Cytophagales bacterium]
MTAVPPIAKIVPKELETHGHKRIDNYYWLNDKENIEVIDYLKAENAYLDTILGHTKEIQEKLFAEMKGRIKEQDESVPYKLDDYFYYTRYEVGKEYAIYCRKKGTLDAKEEIMIDGNELAKGHSYFSLGGIQVSFNQDIIAYSTDTVSRRIYTLYFKNLATGELLQDVIPNITGNVAWANDNKTIFYSRQDLQTLRSDKIYKHILGTDSEKDELIFEEKDETFSTGIYRTKSKKYMVIASSSTLTTEASILNADKPNGNFELFLPREREHEYGIDHVGDKFYIRTNWQAKNFRLMETTENQTTDKAKWREVIAHRANVLLEGFEIFKNFLVLEERKEGLMNLRIIKSDQTEHYVDFGEPTYAAGTGTNLDFNTNILRYGYTSLTTPSSTFDYNMDTKEKTLLKQQEVVGNTFKPANYQSERVYATAADGTKIPISLVYKKGTPKDGTAHLYQYAYGSYGYSIDAGFSSTRLSLLDRGFVFAICHIRGGEEMGRHWYEDGKLLKKKNTFTDFIACSEHLVKEKYTSTDKLIANGGSAGGLLMGAITNMRPDLYKAVVADVPFVDVITTMLDESIPLTTGEFDEWGNPKEKEYYNYMLSYSPYDNVEKKAYPNMLVTTGLHDSQVQYWEPAKWVAKLRAMKTDNNVLLLKTNMEAGHGGASGRFESLKEIALEYAFLFDILGISAY